MKKNLLALLVVSPILLAGCGGGNNPGTSGETSGSNPGSTTVDPTTVTITIPPTTVEPVTAAKLKIRFHVDSKSAEGIAYKTLIDAFNRDYKQFDVSATATFVARTAGDSAYERQLATDKLEGTLPDVITFDAPNCSAYAKAGYLWDITSEFTDDERAKYMNVNTYQSKMYGVPIQESSAGFFYNKNIFRDAGVNVDGISVDNPWTYDEFKEACKKIKNFGKTAVDMRINATDETATYLLYPFIYASGGDFVDSTGYTATGHFNSTASKRGFQSLKDLITAEYTGYGIGATDFFDGRVGMYLSSGWTIPQLDNEHKTVFPNRDSWGLLPYPKDVSAASANGSWCYAVGDNGKAANKKAAVALVKYLTNAAASKAITDVTGMIPSNKDVNPQYTANSPEDVLYQQLEKTGRDRPRTVGYPQFSTAFRQVISTLGDSDVSTLVDSKATVLQNELDKLNK